MSFNIERGLFKFEFTDHHAVLGVPLDAPANDIRKRYIKISRRLHPDTCAAESEPVKQQASQLFAKLVNPAYEKLFGEQTRAEHTALLGRMGKRLVQEREKIQFNSDAAKQLSRSNNWEHEYKTALKTLAEKQYESIEEVIEKIAQISELNMIYLLRKASQGAAVTPQPAVAAARTQPAAAAKSASSQSTSAPSSAKPQMEREVKRQEPASLTEPYCRRAEEYIEKNSFAKAILELKDALKLEPNNSRCHSLLAKAYLRQQQTTMAKIHLQQALKLAPQDPTVLEVKKEFEQAAMRSVKGTGTGTATPQKGSPQKATPQKKPGNDKPSGGLFGGLFGGKKK